MRSFTTCTVHNGDKIKDEIGAARRTHEIRNAYKILVGKPEGKRPVGRPRHKWEDNIKIYVGEIGWEGVDWIHLAHDRDQLRVLVNTVMNLRFI
jgi:hypothetical protein